MSEFPQSDLKQPAVGPKAGRRRRIVHVIPTLDEGGAEKQLCLLAAGLPQDQFDVRVCVLTRTGPRESTLQAARVPVIPIQKQRKIDLSAWLRLRKVLRELQPDLVHTWLFAANAYGRQAALAAGCRHVIASERCVDRWKTWVHFAIDRRLSRKSDCIIANSNAVKDFLVQHRIAADRVKVIRNGIELAEPAGDHDRLELRRQLKLPADSNVIVAVGRLWPQKRYKDLIWAADLIKCIRDDTHFIIVGDGPQRLALQRYTEQVEILDKVHFLGHRSDAEELIRRADLLWCGSEYEGASNAVLEAMASGTPVIATDIDANRELLEHQKHGILFPVGDRASLAKWSQHLIEHPEERSRLAQAARQRVARQFSVSRMIDRHVTLYNQLFQETT